VRRSSGFTIVEIIVVLLLMSIMAATLLGRSITSSTLDLNSATDKIRNHIRFAQAQAMKTADTTNPVWGIGFSGDEYWLFRGTNVSNEVRLPGAEYASGNRINLSSVGILISTSPSTDKIFFDSIGKPYTTYPTTPIPSQLSITLTSGTQNRAITVESETGLVR
jgi:prepilin-type N-terminal cleavage/methylation domain-containing protein